VYFKTSRCGIWVLPLLIFTVLCFREFDYSVLKPKKTLDSSASPLTYDCVYAQEHINFIVWVIKDSGKYLTSDRFFGL